jgi:hypothetical protein
MNQKLSTRKERILINLDKAEINALDNLAAESRRTRSGVLAILIGKANHDAQIKAVLGGGR